MADDSFWTDVGEAAGALLVAVTLSNALKPKQKTGSMSAEVSWQQPLPPCIYFAGDFSRTAGAVLFKEALGNTFTIILALSDGRLDAINGIWLGDDKIDSLDGAGFVTQSSRGGTVNTDGRYVDSRVQILTRMGLPTETAYAPPIENFPGLWTEDHRGDNTGTIMVRNIAPRDKFFVQAFPNRQTETVAVVTRMRCYDWRDGTQARLLPETWKASASPFVWLVHYEWTRWGMDWDSQIAPVLDALTAGANVCDQAVARAGGGTEPRYTCAFNFTDESDEREVRRMLLEAMDGFHTLDGFNRLVLKPGIYEAPTVTLRYAPDDGGEILEWEWTAGTPPEQAVSEINIRFTDPATDYNAGDTDPWPVSDRGKPADLDIPQVYQWRQGRRLAKRMASRLNPRHRGSILTDLRGMVAWPERYVRISNPEEPSMDDVVCELDPDRPPELDILAATVRFYLIEIDANIDAWNPATEEGNPPTLAPRTAGEALSDPVIGTPTVLFVDTSSARISYPVTGPSRSDITWSGGWRIHGSGSWNEFTDTSLSGGSVTLSTSTLPVNASIDIKASYRTAGGGQSDEAVVESNSTSTALIAPGPVTSPTATGGAGKVDLTWINPLSGNYNRAVIRRATNSGMSAGLTTVATLYGSAGQAMSHSDTGLSAGTYYYSITAYNAASAASTTPAPQPMSATAT